MAQRVMLSAAWWEVGTGPGREIHVMLQTLL